MSTSESSGMIDRVKEYLDSFFLSEDQPSMILGVSGGPDSMCLLYIFSILGVNLTVVHCNYQLRGEDSNDDQQLVEDTASMWGFETISARIDPAEAGNINFQNWARDRRYRIFRDLKKERGADAIVTAHHQDDQLETIIQKILRGAGMTAWQGMKVWDGELFRPLLDVSKAELLQFASANHIPYRLDISNEESTYARNFLRHGWFPVLDDLFPGWRDNILKVPDRAREYEALTQSLIEFLKPDDGSIGRGELLALPSEVQKPLLLHVLKSVDRQIPVSTGALMNLDKLATLQTGKKLAINKRWSLLRDRDRFILTEESEGGSPEVEITRPEALENSTPLPGLLLEVARWDGNIDPARLQLDADRLKWPLKLRNWKKGDAINPFGMDGTQKLSDLLTNEKIPAAGKPYVKVLETFEGNICAVIFPAESENRKAGTIAHWARCHPDETANILLISHKKSGESR